MTARLCDELPFALGWGLAGDRLRRTAHALAADGRVWLVDAIDAPGALPRAAEFGDVAAVVQLLDRHERDCAAIAERLGVPHLVVPFAGVPGSPFQVVPLVRRRFWREVALWWPQRRALVCADALGTAPFFLAPGERLGVHPLLRLAPPRGLDGLDPEHVLCGHGDGVHRADAAPALRTALAGARRRLPAAWLAALREGARL